MFCFVTATGTKSTTMQRDLEQCRDTNDNQLCIKRMASGQLCIERITYKDRPFSRNTTETKSKSIFVVPNFKEKPMSSCTDLFSNKADDVTTSPPENRQHNGQFVLH